ncbi:hypothetical protein EDB84DRAFT_1632910 [Lactarius hengduanensis]|nr:hypothetical protein EDB84DRAFT_1632910 [Lactarius hengduanensis]
MALFCLVESISDAATTPHSQPPAPYDDFGPSRTSTSLPVPPPRLATISHNPRKYNVSPRLQPGKRRTRGRAKGRAVPGCCPSLPQPSQGTMSARPHHRPAWAPAAAFTLKELHELTALDCTTLFRPFPATNVWSSQPSSDRITTWIATVSKLRALAPDTRRHQHRSPSRSSGAPAKPVSFPYGFSPLPRPRSRVRSNTSPSPVIENTDSCKQFTASFFHLDHKYKVSWECAELLIELGGGPPAPPSQPNSSTLPSAQQLTHPGESISGPRSRERAITLAGDESAPPLPVSIAGPSTTSPPGEWRGSTGRNDLSQRQLWLLHDMLSKSDASPTMLASLHTLEEIPVNRRFLWGEATSSTITLPSEESGRNASPTKKRRYSRLGMSGLRDMLRSLTRGHQPPPVPPLPFRPASSASTSASSSYDDQSTYGQDQQHHVAKSTTGPDATPSSSIFRFAQKGKPSPPAAEQPREHSRPPHLHARILHSYSGSSDLASHSGTLDGKDDEYEDEEWDHIDAAEDLDRTSKPER